MNLLESALAHMRAQDKLVRSLRCGSDLDTSYAYDVFPGNSHPVACKVLNAHVWPHEHLRPFPRNHDLLCGVQLARDDLLAALGQDIQLTVYAHITSIEDDPYVAVRAQSPKGAISVFTGSAFSAFHYPFCDVRFIDTDGSCSYLRTTETHRYIKTAEDVRDALIHFCNELVTKDKQTS